GARHAIIGPNGAGKTTFINLLTGALRPSGGSVHLAGNDITAMSQPQRVKHGIARTFQINTLFMGLTVIDNLYLAVAERMCVATKMLRPAGKMQPVLDEASRLLHVLKLENDALTEIHELPYGRQRLVEIAIALALEPKVLLLDEPAAGVPNTESHIILDAVDALPKDIAVLIIEHDMDVVFRFAERITVLVRGAILAEGPPAEIAANEEVQAVYLGEGTHV
ncbi:MAG: ATP-binding cassette domain-containing protein, partial [Rhodospirillales bacterium]|nr:ATP-binding cassette domain-containing protein [Rhodospirillales bacterium]